MPQRDPGVYLEDIEHYAAAAVRFTSGFSLQQYLADEKTRAAVERVLEVCGEAMSNLYRVAPAVAETIPHARDIIGFRNILAHGYAELDHNQGLQHSHCTCATASSRRAGGIEGVLRSTIATVIDCPRSNTSRLRGFRRSGGRRSVGNKGRYCESAIFL